MERLLPLIALVFIATALFFAHRSSKWLRRIVTRGRAASIAAGVVRWFASLATLVIPGRAILFAVAIVCSASVVTVYAAPIFPETLDELAIPMVAVLHLLFAFTRISKHQIAASTTCQSCGYDLSNTPDKPCPECGMPYAQAIAVNAHRLTMSPAGVRAVKGWALGALAITLCGPVGFAAAVTRHLVHGINWPSSVQLVQQYEGHAAAPIMTAMPLAIAAALIILVSPLLHVPRIWLLIPLGVAACLALRLFV